MTPKITTRQSEFLEALAVLVAAERSPIHYTRVASALGVNRFSAYDMLRVLESKGLVTSDYVLANDKDGPGRSKITFHPTDAGMRVLESQGKPLVSLPAAPIHGNAIGMEEWTAFKEAILRRLRESGMSDSRELLHDLLNQLPERRRSLTYCAQMVSALVVNLERVGNRMASVNPFEALAALATGDEESVRALAGLSLGSAMVAGEAVDPGIVAQFMDQMHSFQVHLQNLGTDGKRRLGTFLQEAIQVLTSPAATPVSVAKPREHH